MSDAEHCPIVYRDGDHFWLTCCGWRHDPASNDPDDGVRWDEWQRALQAHVDSAPVDEVVEPGTEVAG